MTGGSWRGVLLAIVAGSVAAFISAGCGDCLPVYGDTYRCVCDQPTDAGTVQSATEHCVQSSSEASSRGQAACGSSCSCTCTRRDDTDLCVIRANTCH